MKIQIEDEVKALRLTKEGLQLEADGLAKNCDKWKAKVYRIYRIADKMAAKCSDRNLRQKYWMEKSRGSVILPIMLIAIFFIALVDGIVSNYHADHDHRTDYAPCSSDNCGKPTEPERGQR